MQAAGVGGHAGTEGKAGGARANERATYRLRKSNARHHSGLLRWIVLAGMVVLVLAVLSPLVLVAMNAVKSGADFANSGFLGLPQSWTLDQIWAYWQRVDYPGKLRNSVVIALVTSVLAVLVSLLNAYAIGIGRVRGRLGLILLFLLANMLPAEAMIYTQFEMAKSLGLYNTIWVVIIIFTVIHAAFGTYLLASVMGTFPPVLLEAARLDGAGRLRILWSVVYPIVRPTMVVLFALFFVWTSNEFYIPLVMLVSDSVQTLPLALISLRGQYVSDIPLLNAGALLSLLPTTIFFFVFQRSLTRGVTAGAVK